MQIPITKSQIVRVCFFVFFFVYSVSGIYTALRFVERRPIPQTLFEDFRIYEDALQEIKQGINPYGKSVDSDYPYPPQLSLFIDLFSSISTTTFKRALYMTITLTLLMLLVYGVMRHYKLEFNQVWFWYFLCLGFAPFLELLEVGQINMLTLFGIFLLFIWEERYPILAGFGLAVAVLTKVSPALFFIYLITEKKFRLFTITLLAIIAITGLTLWRFGAMPFLEYPSALQYTFTRLDLSPNSQIFAAKFAGLQNVLSEFFPVLGSPRLDYALVQRFVYIYVLAVIVFSSTLTFLGKQPREYLFVITLFGMTLSPNVMWYHHYVFLLLPVLIWMGWSRLDWKIVAWCLMGLLVIQIERFFFPYGLLTHLFGHISILILLFFQIRDYRNTRSPIVTSAVFAPGASESNGFVLSPSPEGNAE